MTKTIDKVIPSSDVPALFPRWREVLHNDERLSAQQVQSHERHIFSYLEYLKACCSLATVASALNFLQSFPEIKTQVNQARAALRWFFRSATQQATGKAAQTLPDSIAPVTSAPSARNDSVNDGKRPWDQRMVAVLRIRHMQLRTEQSYMGWARRFERWLSGKSVENTSDDDVRNYLEYLAVEGRVAVSSTQCQALNALVFLYRKVLQLDLGDVSGYTRARAGKRMPVVLSQQQYQALFQELSGTYLLMAQ